METNISDTKKLSKPDSFYYNSVGGDWVEVYLKTDQQLDIIHTMFWSGSGFIPKHKHSFIEQFLVLEGKGYYFVENVGHLNTRAQKVIIPEGTLHINPVNQSDRPLVVL
jgi:anti-sigma factor ChrR (cupin superfamily)